MTDPKPLTRAEVDALLADLWLYTDEDFNAEVRPRHLIERILADLRRTKEAFRRHIELTRATNETRDVLQGWDSE